jgi:hypothetical protein
MTITSYQIQNVLRTYGRQLLRGKFRNRTAQDLNASTGEVNLNRETKRKQVIDQIAKEVLRKITLEGVFSDTGKEALAKLSQEIGQPLEIIPAVEGEWEFSLIPVAESALAIEAAIAPSNSEALKERLYQITYDIIDQNTLTR